MSYPQQNQSQNQNRDDLASSQRQGNFESDELYQSDQPGQGFGRSGQDQDTMGSTGGAPHSGGAFNDYSSSQAGGGLNADSDHHQTSGVTGTQTGPTGTGQSDWGTDQGQGATGATTKPGMGAKMRGTAEKAAGKATGNPGLVGRGQERKGEFTGSDM